MLWLSICHPEACFVGNREEAFKLALEHDCAVLITGGFDCSDEIKELADQKGCLLFPPPMILLPPQL